MKRLLIAAVAGCALNTAALADDLTFTWNFTGTTKETPRSQCSPSWLNCVPITHDFSGTFSLTVPDDTHDYSREVVKGDFGTETISFQTSGGQLLFYDLVDDFLDTSDLSWRHLYLTTDGGIEYAYVTEPEGYVTSTTQRTFGDGLPPPGPGPAPVPEPEQALLLITGLAVLGARARRQSTRLPLAS